MLYYKLIKEGYPNHKVGELSYYNPNECDSNFLWETGGKVPQDFQPDQVPDWFEKVIQASVGLIYENGKILAVSRKNNYNDFGFIGGKLDENETPENALIREVLEETGIKVLKYTYIDKRLDETGCLVHLYEINEWEYNKTFVKNPCETGLVKWVRPEVLCSESSSYKEYNKVLLESLELC